MFDLLKCEHYLLVFDGGDHMVFSGRPVGLDQLNLPGAGSDGSKDGQFQAFVKAATLQFFDAYLKGNDGAKRWLTADDGAKAALGKDGTWERVKGKE